MNIDNAVCIVIRDFQRTPLMLVPLSAERCQHKITLFIVAARCTNGGYKILIYIVKSCQIGGSAPPVAAVYNLVCTLENQMLVIILKSISNLSPNRVVFLHNAGPLVIGSADIQPILVVVVHIYDYVQIIVVSIADNLFDTRHKFIFDFIAIGVVYPAVPRNGYAHSVKALLCYLVEHRLSCSRVAPAGFNIINRIAVAPALTPAACCLKRVTEIPARLKIIGKINGR